MNLLEEIKKYYPDIDTKEIFVALMKAKEEYEKVKEELENQ